MGCRIVAGDETLRPKDVAELTANAEMDVRRYPQGICLGLANLR